MRKYYKYSMNMTVGTIVSFVLLIIFLIPVYTKLVNGFNDVTLLISFILYIPWMFLHEALHGLGHIVCGVKPSELSYGAKLEKSVLFCLIRKEVNKKDILISLIFPFIFIGVVTYIIGIIINSPILLFLSIMNMSGACMDLIMFFKFISLGSDITYIEPGDGTSFYLMSDKPVKKIFGCKLESEGEYKPDMFSNNSYKKFDISKTSVIIFVAFIILILIALFI